MADLTKINTSIQELPQTIVVCLAIRLVSYSQAFSDTSPLLGNLKAFRPPATTFI